MYAVIDRLFILSVELRRYSGVGMSYFAGKVVLVTGASSGIGKATAEAFAQHATYLAITGRNRVNLAEVAASCMQKGAKEVLQIVAEFSNLDDVDTVVEKTIQKFGGLNILVNNAGLSRRGSLEDATMDDFDLLFNVNVKAMVRITQQAMPHLVKEKGNVVNVSSFVSQRPLIGILLYNMTKAAVDQFTKTVALEYAPKGVRVNAVNPAMVMTNIQRYRGRTQEETEKYYAGTRTSHPIGRNGTVEEIAKAILFLASDDSGWTTGQCLFLDGGRSLTVA